jgi:NAD+ diphosphatase
MTEIRPLDLPLSRTAIDRDHEAREREGLLDELWADASTRVLVLLDGQALLAAPGRLALLSPDAVPRPALSVYLGRTLDTIDDGGDGPVVPAGTRILAAALEDAGHLAEADWADLRRIGNLLADLDAGILTQALGVLNWHASHAFSPRTGEPTAVTHAGWVRADPLTGHQVFPRTDAAVIVAVHDADGRILLGANAMWESKRFSLLAGFVEPGESLEAAVVREVFEESGVRVRDPKYLGSQPWPFPASLMLGFEATADASVPTPDGTEIVALRWFERAEIADLAGRGEIILPGPASIARAIIERWYGGPIADSGVPFPGSPSTGGSR